MKEIQRDTLLLSFSQNEMVASSMAEYVKRSHGSEAELICDAWSKHMESRPGERHDESLTYTMAIERYLRFVRLSQNSPKTSLSGYHRFVVDPITFIRSVPQSLNPNQQRPKPPGPPRLHRGTVIAIIWRLPSSYLQCRCGHGGRRKGGCGN